MAVTTQRTITVRVDWESQGVESDGSPAGVYVGSAQATLVRRQPTAFTFDIAKHRVENEPWNGTVSRTISPAAISLTVEASGTIGTMTCTTGSLPLTLDRFTGGPVRRAAR